MNEASERIAAMSVADAGTVRQAMKAIDAGMLGMALLHTADGAFAGLVTDGDLRRALLGGGGLETPLSAVRRASPITIQPSATAEEIAAIARAHPHVRCLPALDDDGRVVDLVTLDSRPRLPVSEPHLGEQELENVIACVVSGWISSAGGFVRQFEEDFARFCGCRHAVAVSSGTAALHLALLALGIGPGDEVVVPALTFVATANAVTYTGARPVFADVEATTWNIDPGEIDRLITRRTKAVLPVHLYGHPADMDPILDVARARGLHVVEDAAEAHGARYKERVAGTIGELGCFSFYGNKILTTGEGGMVVGDRAELIERVRLLRDHGMDPPHSYRHPVVGYNYRMTNLQAAVGVAQLGKVAAILQAKERIARHYAARLGDVPGIGLPPRAPWARPVCWLYTILVEEARFGCSRDALAARLREGGVDTRPIFPPLHTQPIYHTGERLPVAERLAGQGLSLPSAVTVKDVEIQRLTRLIRDAGGTPGP